MSPKFLKLIHSNFSKILCHNSGENSYFGSGSPRVGKGREVENKPGKVIGFCN